MQGLTTGSNVVHQLETWVMNNLPRIYQVSNVKAKYMNINNGHLHSISFVLSKTSNISEQNE